MPTKSPLVAFSAVEFAFLASLWGAESLTGVPDPFVGWSDEAIDAAWGQAQQSLAERHLISLGADGSITIEDEVAELVGICGYAEATFLLTCSRADGSAAGHHFHIIRHSAVEVVLTDLTCQLIGLDTRAVLDRVAAIFQLGGQGAPAVPNGRVAEGDLHAARDLAARSGAGAAEERLQAAGLQPRTAAALAVSLSRPVASGALVLMPGDQGKAEVDGISLLEGENGLWLLRRVFRGPGRWVDVVPCSAEDLQEFIRSMMNRVLPGKLL